LTNIKNDIVLFSSLNEIIQDLVAIDPSLQNPFYDVTGMINRIVNSTTWNVTIKEANIPLITDASGNSIQTNAKTTAENGSVIITFNDTYLNAATDLAVARTMIHESMHSYFVYGLGLPLDVEYENFKVVHSLLFDKKGNPTNDQNLAQHQQMAIRYTNQIAALLEQYAVKNNITSPVPGLSLLDYCKDLAWGGLEGTKGYRLYAPDKSRIESNIIKENTNDPTSTQKKGC